jgi:hypothetical protein
MKLWILRPIETGDFTPWERFYYNSYGFLISANSEERARTLAQESGKEEIYDDDVDFDDVDFEKIPAWTDPKWSTCVELKPEMLEKEEVVMADINNE